jgi:hypothetical protein
MIALDDASKANWHMLLYGLIQFLMDDVRRQMNNKFASMCWMPLRPSASASRPSSNPVMGFNRRKIEADGKAKADPEAVNRRATEIEDVEQLITA